MPNEKKPLTAIDACRAFSKAMRSELLKMEPPLNPKQAGIKVTKAIASQIKEYEEQLAKLASL